MKKINLLLLAIFFMAPFFFSNAQAQSNKEEIEFFQSIFGMEKKQAVAQFLELSPEDPFWAIYDEYESERKQIGAERIASIGKYIDMYGNMQDSDFDTVVSTMTSLRKQNDKLVDSFYKKVKKVSGSKVAAQFFQLEEYILSETRSFILESIPFIGEFEK